MPMISPLQYLFVLLNRVRVRGRGNRIDPHGADIKRCSIRVRGNANEFRCRSLLKQSAVMIEGNGNRILIEEGGELRNLRLWIKGDNCEIRIGPQLIFNGGRVVCAGNGNGVSIGDDCMFAEGIEIWASDTHPVYQGDSLINPSRSISIGNHVWLGTNAMVLKGSRIADGSIVGMASLVRGEIPANCMAVGNPARIVKSGVRWDKSGIGA